MQMTAYPCFVRQTQQNETTGIYNADSFI